MLVQQHGQVYHDRGKRFKLRSGPVGPGRGPAVVRGKEGSSVSHEGFESLTLASLAPVAAKRANWSHMGKVAMRTGCW